MDLLQLDDAAQITLKSRLLDYLKAHKSTLKAVNTQNCLSLVDLAIQMPTWPTATIDLINTFGHDSDSQFILLEVLALLPEEIMHNYLIPIEKDLLISQSDSLLADASDQVFHLLISLLNQNTNLLKTEAVMKCLASWLKSGDIKVETVSQTPVIPFSFQSLKCPELFDVAVDIICEVIARSGGDLNRVQGNQDTITQVYNGLVELKNAAKIDDGDMLKGFCRMFVEAGEGYCDLIMTNFDLFKPIVETILEFAGVEDLEVAKLTFNFWFVVCEDLSSTEFQQMRPIFYPVYIKLLESLLKHLQYPPDLNEWTAEERDDFRDFRHEIGDVLKDCVKVLGEVPTLEMTGSILQGFSQSSKLKWQEIEAVLFCLRCIGSAISPNQDRVLPEIMNILPNLPPHPKIKYATILVIGRYSEWTRNHPDFLTPQLNFISKGFEEQEAVSAAALSLKYLCESCGSLMTGHLAQLFPFYNQIIDNVPIYDQYEITQALSHVVYASNHCDLLSTLQEFCLPIAKKVHALTSFSGPFDTEQSKQTVDTVKGSQ